MPFQTQWTKDGALTRFQGDVTTAVLLEHLRVICNHSRFDELRYSILDFRDARDAVDDGELLAVVAQLMGASLTNPRIHVVAVSTDDGVIQHLARFSERGYLKLPLRVFSTPESAIDWLIEQSVMLS